MLKTNSSSKRLQEAGDERLRAVREGPQEVLAALEASAARTWDVTFIPMLSIIAIVWIPPKTTLLLLISLQVVLCHPSFVGYPLKLPLCSL